MHDVSTHNLPNARIMVWLHYHSKQVNCTLYRAQLVRKLIIAPWLCTCLSSPFDFVHASDSLTCPTGVVIRISVCAMKFMFSFVAACQPTSCLIWWWMLWATSVFTHSNKCFLNRMFCTGAEISEVVNGICARESSRNNKIYIKAHVLAVCLCRMARLSYPIDYYTWLLQFVRSTIQ